MSTPSRLALAASLLLVGSCGTKAGTFVLVGFTSDLTNVKSIALHLTLDGSAMADVHFTPDSGLVTFPSTGSIEIGSGAGSLVAVATATDASGATVATANGTTTVVRDTTSTMEIALTSTVTQPDMMAGGALSILPSNYPFGTAVVSAPTQPKMFVVSNAGPMATGAVTASIAGANAADFELVGMECAGKMLAASKSCTVSVRFNPQSAGLSKNAQLVVAAPAGTPGGSASADLSGMAGVSGNLSFNTMTSSYGGITVNTSTAGTTFTLKNSGTQATNTLAVSLTGSDKTDFQITENLCDGQSLPGNGTCTVKVKFAPTERGMLMATLTAVEMTTGVTATVGLSGIGQIAAMLAITSNAATSSSPFDLGTVTVGSTGTTTYSFTVTNNGDFTSGPLTFANVPEIFQLSPSGVCQTGMTLDPGASCTGSVALEPTTFGAKNATLTISSTLGGSVTTYVKGVGQDMVTIDVATSSSDGATGKVTDSATPMNLDCGTTCTKVYTRDTTTPMLTLVAVADPGSTIDHWIYTGGGPVCTEGINTSTCTVPLDSSVVAGTFTYTAVLKKGTYTLHYNRSDYQYVASPVGLGILTIDTGTPTVCNGPCSDGGTGITVPSGTTVTVTATGATVGAGYSLRHIGGPCSSSASGGSSASCTFAMSADATINVTYSAHNYMFVSSHQFPNANLGGISGADTQCNADAAAASLPGTFKSWLSSSTVDAKFNVAGGNGWVRPDGRPFAHTLIDLTMNHAVLYPPALDPTGTPHVGENVFTATGGNGMRQLQGDMLQCGDWTSSASVVCGGATPCPAFLMGTPSAGGIVWTGNAGTGGPDACSAIAARVYCFGTDLVNPLTQLPLGGTRLAFVTSTTLTPPSSVANADALCTAAATTNSALSAHTFEAFIAGSGTSMNASAGSRFADGAPWARLDGVLVSNTALGLIGSAFAPIAAFNQMQDGTYLAYYDRVWTGGPAPSAPPLGNDACTAWTSTAGAGEAGNAELVGGKLFGDPSSLLACTQSLHVYCLEP